MAVPSRIEVVFVAYNVSVEHWKASAVCKTVPFGVSRFESYHSHFDDINRPWFVRRFQVNKNAKTFRWGADGGSNKLLTCQPLVRVQLSELE